MPAPFNDTSARSILFATMLSGMLLSTGCAEHRHPRPAPSPAPITGASANAADNTAALMEKTGIPACDDYLSTYLACHRAAGSYPEEQLLSRYEAMHASLLHDSQAPEIRPQLANRCHSLSSQLQQALHGKSCVAASDTP